MTSVMMNVNKMMKQDDESKIQKMKKLVALATHESKHGNYSRDRREFPEISQLSHTRLKFSLKVKLKNKN